MRESGDLRLAASIRADTAIAVAKRMHRLEMRIGMDSRAMMLWGMSWLRG